ncbi:hypothetical protein LXA43DRAFT_1090149 [Ganoderma leucocontextum]|nr:hypothetical protein LXA43DRAFT_1090149 [Ganoderma leucocontextum]
MTIDDTPYDLTSIPTEIWQNIITLACTDGGSTGRSLILTSKLFHAQANDSRFTSLALFSLDQAERFLAFVRSRPSEWRYPVRHLWLSFLNDCLNGWGRESILSAKDDSDLEWHMRFDRAMHDLLALVAPALRTLTLSQGDRQRLPCFRLDFPMLKELTVWGNISAVELPHSGTCAPHLPALQRFHFVTNKPSARTHLLAPTSWLSASPITHLRLSDLNDVDEETGFASALARALGARMPGRFWSSPIVVPTDPVPSQGKEIILSHLRYLWIHGIEWFPSTCSEAELEDKWEVLKYKLQEVRVAAWEREVWALVMERSWRKGTVWERRLWDDWLDRMEGGRGCWVDSEDEEKALEGPDIVGAHEGGQIWD